jgi:hypothetical protein
MYCQPQLVMQLVSRLDEQGDGFVDLHEFIAAFDMSPQARARRAQVPV